MSSVMVFVSTKPVKDKAFEFLSVGGVVMCKVLYNDRINCTSLTHADLHDSNNFKFKELRQCA